MGLEVFDYSVNVIAYEKNGKKYGMTCAWAMQVDYDKIVCLLGAQSQTGKHIMTKDIIGVSVLGKKQKEIAEQLGQNHSPEENKFKDIDIKMDGTAVHIVDATRILTCEVIDVVHLKEIEEDNLIYARILRHEENGDDFLHYGEF